VGTGNASVTTSAITGNALSNPVEAGNATSGRSAERARPRSNVTNVLVATTGAAGAGNGTTGTGNATTGAITLTAGSEATTQAAR
jgi:hypothetical protein